MAEAIVQQPEQRWLYNQRTGQLRHPDGRLDPDRGYSGIPEYLNNPDAEHLEGQGPIPRGQWRMGNAFTSNRTGPLSIPLTPIGHNAHGRTVIQAHGDRRNNPNRDASQGCPILNRRQREAMSNSPVRRFDVVDEPEWQQ